MSRHGCKLLLDAIDVNGIIAAFAKLLTAVPLQMANVRGVSCGVQQKRFASNIFSDE